MSISPDNKYGRLLASDKQFTLHATLLWVLRAHVEAHFQRSAEISGVTNVKRTEICGARADAKLLVSTSCCFWFCDLTGARFQMQVLCLLLTKNGQGKLKMPTTKSDRSHEGKALLQISRACCSI